MSEWKEFKLGELAEITSSKRIFYSDYVLEGIPFFRSKEIIEKALGQKTNETLYISKERYTDIKQKFGSPVDGDLLISAVGERAGIPYVVKDLGDFYFKDGNLIWLRNIKSELNIDYFCYWLKSVIGQFSLESIMIGSAQKALTIIGLKNLEISIPTPSTQKAIANLLFSLDNKIDLLHRQNATLEAIAETLFRQWFVEEANDKWKKVKIRDFDIIVTDFVANGSFASLKENVTLITDREDYALFIRNTDLKSGFVNKTFVDEHAYNFLSKTKLYGGEVIISSVGDVGSVFRCPKFNIPMTLGNNVVMLKSKYNNFFYLFFNSEYGQNLIYGITSGSVQEKFNKTTFRDLELSYPSVEYIEEFEETVKIYFDKIDLNKAQIRTLTTLRDTLLPKLMSGEVRVNINEMNE